MWLCSLAHLLYHLFEFGRHFRNRLTIDLHCSVGIFSYSNIHLAEGWVLRGVIIAELGSATLFSLDSRAGDGFGDREQVGKVEGRVPARVVFPVASHSHVRGSLPQSLDSIQRTLHLVFLSHDTDQFLHHLLKLELNLVRSVRV